MSVVRPQVAIKRSVAVPPSSFVKITEYLNAGRAPSARFRMHMRIGRSVKRPTVFARA
jgi:hypothetical protein